LFLSHATADSPLAARIRNHVEETGKATVYLAELDVQPGRLLADKVQAEIRRSDATVWE
jgi:TIR domain